eukprot:TRINITY_DN84012_c0_g1_i1.p1 TRINITY_DN84012_c0_g1~~TRINITY_DN84012_c0_g1_i1.p1  ORF type:complete len:397 (-),score=68.00 TRINITY_DN84012_c0_g1_i1:78-1205(-)
MAFSVRPRAAARAACACAAVALLSAGSRSVAFQAPASRGPRRLQSRSFGPSLPAARPAQRKATASEAPEVTRTEGGAGPLRAFWKFLRPHTIRGTILGSSAMVARVVIENGQPPDWSLLPTAALGVLALLCGNGYIVGINQIYDVSIDVINKPFLPVAAKELSVSQAWFLVIAMAVCGSYLAWHLFGSLIGSLYIFGLFLGTIYSVPPRLKKSAVAAALIIATVRGFLLNFGVYYATRAMLKVPFTWSYPTAFITCFCFVYAIVIAVTKDLPDVQGDLENKIDTFATRFGVGKVSVAATAVLLANYAAALLWSLGPTRSAFRPQVLLTAHGVLAVLLVRGALRLKAAEYNQEGIKAFYRLIWFLFYSEYLLFPWI